MDIKLEDLGFNELLEGYRIENNLEAFDIGRIISEHKERYEVKTVTRVFQGELMGNLRYAAESRADFPAVGDWVAISAYDEDKVLIHKIYPRKSIVERQAVGNHAEKQIIATNIDFGILIQSVDRDFNINRLERYLTICHDSDVKPIIVLNKIDLIDKQRLDELLYQVRDRVNSIPIIAISNETKIGISKLKALIRPGKTYCLLGSSGVGKSSLLNNLFGAKVMDTNSISDSNNKGRHITSFRALVLLKGGGVVIDNPGMREIGAGNSGAGLETTFSNIIELSKHCKYKDCSHEQESNCAIREAIDNGVIDIELYDNYQKMKREQDHYDSSTAEKRRKDKDLGKMIKQALKTKKSSKY